MDSLVDVGFVQPGINIFRRPTMLHPFGPFFADCIPITLVSATPIAIVISVIVILCISAILWLLSFILVSICITMIALIPLALTMRHCILLCIMSLQLKVLFMESYSVARRIASTNNELHILNASQELVANGIANLLGSVSSAYPVSGSFSRSSLNQGMHVLFTFLLPVSNSLFLFLSLSFTHLYTYTHIHTLPLFLTHSLSIIICVCGAHVCYITLHIVLKCMCCNSSTSYKFLIIPRLLLVWISPYPAFPLLLLFCPSSLLFFQ